MTNNSWFKLFKDTFHLKTLIISATASIVWILCSDYLVHVIFGKLELLQTLQNFKGILSMMIFCFVLAWVQKREKKAQEALLLQTRMTSLGQLSASIVHEINNPLQIFALGLDKIHMAHPNEAELESTLDRMETSLKRIQTTIDVLTRLSRNELLDTHVPINVFQLIKDAKEFTNHRFSQQIVLYQYSGEKLLKSKGHPGLLTHLFLNLFSNALDAINENEGWIKVTGEFKDQNTIRISFENSGKPIPSDQVEKIFMPFYTTKARGRGTGLGLFLASQIMAIHHGKFWYETTSPHPKFIIELPVLRVI
jgi:signal transduction histidine kinase